MIKIFLIILCSWFLLPIVPVVYIAISEIYGRFMKTWRPGPKDPSIFSWEGLKWYSWWSCAFVYLGTILGICKLFHRGKKDE